MDRLTTALRSQLMGAIKGRDTKPELIVRRAAHALGHRFRLHRKDLPGRPDLIFPSRRKAIFVHGCFWHRHPGCRMASMPKTQVQFWTEKFDRNVQRDATAIDRLEAAGWQVLIIWECETKDRVALSARLAAFLSRGSIDPDESPC